MSGEDSISGEKDPGIEWRTGLGKTSGECEPAEGLGEGNSTRVLGGVE